MGNSLANSNVPRLMFQQGPRKSRRRRKKWQKKTSTHICVLSVDTSCRYDPCTLLVLIQDNRIGLDVAFDDLETGLVGDTVAVSKSEVSCILVSGHVMGCREVGRAGGRAETVEKGMPPTLSLSTAALWLVGRCVG